MMPPYDLGKKCMMLLLVIVFMCLNLLQHSSASKGGRNWPELAILNWEHFMY